MSNKIHIHKQETIKLNDRIEVRVIYQYVDTSYGKINQFLYIFTIRNQIRPVEILVDIEFGRVRTSAFSFDLLHFQDDLKTIFDFISDKKFEKNIFNY